ncbi:FkbM family methyltransferase [bacterium SCSIO 12741]|nr:FkbM family methyltransferase [bacterium SCSIO 12741]
MVASYFQSTAFKIAVARSMYRLLKPITGKNKEVTRNGIRYALDLSEGIDFSIWLRGNFQEYIFASKQFQLPENAVVMDVGANVGAISLQFARQIPQGKVWAFEPTDYALQKLKTNLKLNPDLAGRIEVTQTFISDQSEENPELKAFSSWSLEKEEGDLHPVHLGTAKSAEGVGAISLDDFAQAQSIDRVDLIKIDTDGYEWEVLKGFEQGLQKYRPAVVFECGLYLLKERGQRFEQFETFFKGLNYDLFEAKSGKSISSNSIEQIIPPQGTADILALPKS